MSHRNTCYDGERLECICGLRGDADIQEAELLSRAEAHLLVEQNSLDVMAAVKGVME